MPLNWRHCIDLSLGVFLPVFAHAQEAGPKGQASTSLFDTEHIFGFAEGSNIGAKGELEIESTTIGSSGALGSYSNIDNETSLRYNVANELRLSLGTLNDYFNIQDVPLLSDRNTIEFGGVIAEARWHILDWRTAPFGMSLSLNPLWRLTDPTSGQQQFRRARGSAHRQGGDSREIFCCAQSRLPAFIPAAKWQV
jgi:hypothetical protein